MVKETPAICRRLFRLLKKYQLLLPLRFRRMLSAGSGLSLLVRFATCGVSGLALVPAGKTLSEACEDNSLRRSSEAMQEHIFALHHLTLHSGSV